jgi:adenylate cyclase
LDESITLNGQHFTKNVPAKILKYLLDSHLREGKSEFEYRELKRLFEISQGQKNSNFEVRFYRLVERLKEECPSVCVEKTGRGRFSLIVNGTLEFKEA